MLGRKGVADSLLDVGIGHVVKKSRLGKKESISVTITLPGRVLGGCRGCSE